MMAIEQKKKSWLYVQIFKMPKERKKPTENTLSIRKFTSQFWPFTKETNIHF